MPEQIIFTKCIEVYENIGLVMTKILKSKITRIHFLSTYDTQSF